MGEFLRKGVAAAAVMAVLATGCGGGGVTRVGGTVSGLAGGTAVTLQLNGGETLVIGGNGGFRFDEQLGAGESFSVTIVGQPARATCTVANAAGEIDRNASSVDNVTVVCTQRHAVGGIVSGLPVGTSVALQNASGELRDSLTVGANGTFAFPTLLLEGAGYTVTVVTPPAGRNCTVEQGTGTVAAADVTSVRVNC